ncbi:MAG: DUF2239 family protein [Acidovorax sp.]|uniref:DUF2239 family protein n=1 Tax=Acidovorax sp. TaxID=1872122 RepID=UPI0039E661AC
MSYTIFQGPCRRLQGERTAVLEYLRQHEADAVPGLRVFDDQTGQRIDLDWRSELAAAAPEPPPSVGRPKLGVTAREVTLLPRHWEWLNSQRGGASAALRRLIDEARKTNAAQDELRAATESSYRFMSDMASDLPGFEEASRALFARERTAFDQHTQGWPEDVRAYLRHLASPLWK